MVIKSFFYPTFSTLPEAWKRNSFTQNAFLWVVSNNFLAPTDYVVKKIQDKGSIQASIKASGIDLFNRQIEAGRCNGLLHALIGRVARAAACAGIVIFAPSIGSIWHLGNCVYQVTLWARGEKQVYIKEHASSFLADLASNLVLPWFILMNSIRFAYLKDHTFPIILSIAGSWGIMQSLLLPDILTFIWGISAQSLDNSYFRFPFFENPTQYSFSLRKRFGLVGENGWPLTFDNNTDLTIKKSEKKGNVVLGGYFYELWAKQATSVLVEFKKIVDMLQLNLDEEQLQSFSSDPSNFFQFLDEWKNSSSPEIMYELQLDEHVTKAKKAFENCEFIKNFISKNSDIRLCPFIFCPASCRPFFENKREEEAQERRLAQRRHQALLIRIGQVPG